MNGLYLQKSMRYRHLHNRHLLQDSMVIRRCR